MKFEKQLNPWIREHAAELSPECLVFAQLYGTTEILLSLSTRLSETNANVIHSSLDTLGPVYGPVFNNIYESYQIAKNEAASVLSGNALSDEFKTKLRRVMIVDPYLVSAGLGPDNIGLNAFIPAYSYALALSDYTSEQFKALTIKNKDTKLSIDALNGEAIKLIHSYVKQLSLLPDRVALNSIHLFFDRAEHKQFTDLNSIYFGTKEHPRKGSTFDTTPTTSCLKLTFFKAMLQLDQKSHEAKHLNDVLVLLQKDIRMEQLSPDMS